jgi:hypothetical protein
VALRVGDRDGRVGGFPAFLFGLVIHPHHDPEGTPIAAILGRYRRARPLFGMISGDVSRMLDTHRSTGSRG